MRAWLFLTLLLPALAVAAPKPFVAGSYETLVREQPRPFMLVLWSVDCPPCHEELAMLGRLRKEQPALPLVLLNTDPGLPGAQADAVLARHGLQGVSSYAFADPVPARLRREVDPDWYGELPRSYFFGRDGGREAHSGLIDERGLRDWLEGK